MSDAYDFDTSAIVKRYNTLEIGSTWIQSLFDTPQTDWYLFSELTVVEVTSAFYRTLREGRITAADLSWMMSTFEHDILSDSWMEPVTYSIIRSAADLIKRHPLPADDAVQLATAIDLDAQLQDDSGLTLLFLSADDRLVKAAHSQGLPAENPNLH